MGEGVIDAWCKSCCNLRKVDAEGLCLECQHTSADRKREAAKYSEYNGGPIYAAIFLEDDANEDDMTCSTCADIGSCGVTSVDDEHLMSGCDLHRRRTKSR